MYRSSNEQQSGQSFTLDVKSEKGETVVRCPNVPEVGEVRDSNAQFAVQHMKRLLDDHVHRGYQQDRSPLMLNYPENDTGE
jgi:hypothetical protein